MHRRRVLTAKVRKARTRDGSARRIVAGFDSEKEFVPFVMFARGGRATAGKGLVEQLCIGDMVGLHPAPVGEGTAACPGDLPGQQFVTPLCSP